MKQIVAYLTALILFLLAACQPKPVEPLSTPTVTRSPYPTRTLTSTMIPPTETSTPTETPIYPTPTESYNFTPLNTTNWLEYALVKYNFTFLYPPNWKVVLDEDKDSQVYKHMLRIMPDEENPTVTLFMGFRFLDEEVKIQRLRTDSGELILYGSVNVMGEDIVRELSVENGRNLAVFYNSGAELRRNQLAMTLVFEISSKTFNNEGLSVEYEQIVDQILASIRLIEEPTATPTLTSTVTITPTITKTATITPTGTLPTATPTETITPTVSPTN